MDAPVSPPVLHDPSRAATDVSGLWHDQGQSDVASGRASQAGSDDSDRPDRARLLADRDRAVAELHDLKAAPDRIRRRNRMITSCLECRRRKLKCDRGHPCSNCARFHRECLFLAPARDPASKMRLMELKDKMGSLEKALERDAVERSPVNDERFENMDSNELVRALKRYGESKLDIPDDEKDLLPSRLTTIDAAFEVEGDESYDIGFKMGKMRINDRLGGWVRPRIVDEFTVAVQNLTLDDDRIFEPANESHFAPGPTYIAPNPSLLFEVANNSLSFKVYLPSRAVADSLIARYWLAVDPVAKMMHRPTFEKQYEDFWLNVSEGLEPYHSLQALVFATLFSATASMQADDVLTNYRIPQKKLRESFQLGTEMALAKARFLRTNKTQTLQALVMYLIPMCRYEISRDHSSLVGTTIRLAECMGFHRDPEEYNCEPIETHIRRIIWYQICYLDYKTGETHGPRPTIRREDYSTKFPLNVNDVDLLSPNPLSDLPVFTDMTLTRMRFECNEMHRFLYNEQLRLSKRQTSLVQVLGQIESFRKAMTAKYGPLMDVPNPATIQREARLIYDILSSRCFVTILHRYYNDPNTPDRLLQLLLSHGLALLEKTIMLETEPSFEPCWWYSGGISTHHMAVLLSVDMYMNPMRKESDRSWRVLDYIYEIPQYLTEPKPGQRVSLKETMLRREKKGRQILQALRDRLAAHQEVRRLRVPRSMREAPLPDTFGAQQRNEGFVAIKEEYEDEDNASVLRTVPINQPAGPPPQPSPQPPPQPPLFPPPATNPPLNSGTSLPSVSASTTQISPFANAYTRRDRLLPVPHVRTQFPTTAPPPSTQTPANPAFTPITTVPPQQPPSMTAYSNMYEAHNRETSGMPSYSSPQQAYTQAQEPRKSSTLWFMPGANGGGAGLASPVQSAHGLTNIDSALGMTGVPGAGSDMTMLDIDWDEWNKLFPPEINTGEINSPHHAQIREHYVPNTTAPSAYHGGGTTGYYSGYAFM